MMNIRRRQELLLQVQIGEKEPALLEQDSPFTNNFPIITHLMFRLSAHIQGVLKSNLEELVDRNAKFTNNFEGYLFEGLQYTLDPRARLTLASLPKIDDSLYDIAKSLEDSVVGFEEDKQKLRQGLVLVLIGTNCWQDVRDALPDLLRTYLPPITPLQRTRPEAYTLQTRPLQKAQYAQTRDMIEYHLSTEIFS